MKNISLSILFMLILFQDILTKNISFFSYLDELLVVFMLICIIFHVSVNKKISKVSVKILLGVLLFVLFLVFSSVQNSVSKEVIILGILLAIKIFIVIVFFIEISLKNNTLKIFVNLINIFGLIAVFFALIDLRYPVNLRETLGTFERLDYRGSIISVQSFFIHPGVYGWYMLFSSIVNYSLYKYNKKRKNRNLFLLFLLFSLFSLRFKVVLGILIILIYDTFKTRKNIWLKIVPSALIISLFTYINMSLIILTIDRYITASVYVSARKALYYFSNIIAGDYFPFGSGIGTFGSWYSRVNYSDLYYVYGLNKVQGLQPYFSDWVTDTYWPSILAESGYFGFLVLLITHAYILFVLFKKVSNNSSHYYPSFIYTISILLTLYSLTESLGEQIYNSAPQFIFIGSLIGLSLKPKEKENNSEKSFIN